MKNISSPFRLVLQRWQDRKTLVFLVFVLISVCIWILNSLNKVHITNVTIPVHVRNIPVGSKVNREIPSSLDISVSGKGFDLLSLNSGLRRDTLVIDIGRISHNEELSGRHAFSTLDLLARLWKREGKLSPVIVEPDSIIVDLSPRTSKLVPLTHNISTIIDRPFGIKGGIVIQPDHVLLLGPDNILEQVSEIRTAEIEIQPGAGENFGGVGLLNPFPGEITLDIPYTYYYMNVVEYTEAVYSIPVSIPVHQRRMLELIPAEVEVKFAVPLYLYDRVSPDDFLLKAELPRTSSLPASLEVQVMSVPGGIRDLRIQPELLDYLIKTDM